MAKITKKEEKGLASPEQGGWEPFRLLREMARWDPFHEGGVPPSWQTARFVPSFDVKEDADSYVLKADLPGIKEEDLNVTLTENRLTVSGERKAEKKNESEQYYAVERSYGSFSRTFGLPQGVNGEKVRADLKEGVLTITVPKKPDVKPKQVQIKVQ